MAPEYKVTCDLFTLPYKEDSQILYAPRQGFACLANQDLINLLASLDELQADALNAQQKAALDFLDEKGVLNGSQEAPVVKEMPDAYSPTMVTYGKNISV